MGKKLLFVFNPHSGKGEIKNKLLAIVQLFTENGWETVVRPTLRAGEIPGLLAGRGSGFDLVVSCGGDGTLNETLNGLMACDPRPLLGYIPAGTVNDFACSLGLPRNMLAAAQCIMEGRPFACDVGAFNNQYFAYVAAFGAFTQVSYETSQPSKNVLGRLAYLLEGIRRLPQIKSYHLAAEYDGHRVEGNYLLGMITNSTSVGGFRLPGWVDVSMSDGLLEVFLIREPQSPGELQNAINSLLSQQEDPATLLHFQTNDLTITSREPIPWTLDGEYGGTVDRAEITSCRKALRILVEKRDKEEISDE